jgi:hypothetical protein
VPVLKTNTQKGFISLKRERPKISHLGTFKAYGFYAMQYHINSSFGMFSLKQNEKDY